MALHGVYAGRLFMVTDRSNLDGFILPVEVSDRVDTERPRCANDAYAAVHIPNLADAHRARPAAKDNGTGV